MSGVSQEKPVHRIGASIASAAPAAATAATLLSPASNTRGAILRTVTVSSGGSDFVTIWADTVAPTGVNDLNRRRIGVFNANGSMVLQLPIYLPPGVGIYGMSNVSGSAMFISYDLL